MDKDEYIVMISMHEESKKMKLKHGRPTVECSSWVDSQEKHWGRNWKVENKTVLWIFRGKIFQVKRTPWAKMGNIADIFNRMKMSIVLSAVKQVQREAKQ